MYGICNKICHMVYMDHIKNKHENTQYNINSKSKKLEDVNYDKCRKCLITYYITCKIL